MNKQFFAVFVGVLIFVANVAWAAPKITCDEIEYSFGAVDRKQKVKHTFIIRNTGDELLKIGKVRACCGATAKIATKSIAPGSNTTVRVSLSLKSRNGKQRKSFYVSSNDPKQPYLQLRMIGTAVATVLLEPRMVDFGQIQGNAVATKESKIICQADNIIQITNIVSTSNRFIADFKSSKDGKEHVISIKTVPPLGLGTIKGYIEVYTDHPKHRKLRIYTVARVSTELIVAPHEVLLKEVVGDMKPVTRHVAIRSRSKKPFKILKVTPPDEDIKIKVTPMGDYGYRFELTNLMPFPDLDGKQILITTDHEGGEEIAIPIKVVK